MIAGTIVMEDHVVSFVHGQGEVTYTVSDSLSGQQETVVCPAPHFFSALSLAVSYNGEFPKTEAGNQIAWKEAENVQPANSALRWIP